MKEPTWVLRAVVDALHHDQLLEHGGLPGVRDESALESALGRPRNKWSYGDATDIAELAAAYAFGLAKNHPFNDGNKRTAFIVMMLFLERNGRTLHVEDAEVIKTFLALAASELAEADLADWIRSRVRRRRNPSG